MLAGKLLKILIVSMFLVVGCTASQEKLDEISQPQHSEPVRTEMSRANYYAPEYHFSEYHYLDNYPGRQNYIQGQTINLLSYDLQLYRHTYGKFPGILNEVIQHEFLLWWPVNIETGAPLAIREPGTLKAIDDDLAAFTYTSSDDDTFTLSSVRLDRASYNATGNIEWLINDSSIDFKDVKEFQPLAMGQIPLDNINNTDIRFLYAMCGNLIKLVSGRTAEYFRLNEVLPLSIGDVLDPRMNLIKETFNSFSRLLHDSGARFKWGFDYAKNTEYMLLEIDGVRYIAGCMRYGPKSEALIKSHGLSFDCVLDELDMSSPMISNENIMDIEIPDAYFISIQDIPGLIKH